MKTLSGYEAGEDGVEEMVGGENVAERPDVQQVLTPHRGHDAQQGCEVLCVRPSLLAESGLDLKPENRRGVGVAEPRDRRLEVSFCMRDLRLGRFEHLSKKIDDGGEHGRVR
jgi:hypothetical protein